MFREQRFGKLLAGAGALALAGAGLMGAAAAHADEAPGIRAPEHGGSITIHTSAAEPRPDHGDGTEQGTEPTPVLEGVEFTLQPVFHEGAAIDLATAAGWKLAEGIIDTTPGQAQPSGYTLGPSREATTNEGGVATFTGLDLGLYLVTETDSGDNLIKQSHAPFWVTVPNPNEDGRWNYDVHVYPKNTLNTISLDKTVDDAAIMLGDEVAWTLEASVPASSLPYKSLELRDVLASHLAFVRWDSVAIGATALVEGTDYAVWNDNSTITLTPAGLLKLDAAQDTTVSAVLVTTVASVPADGKIENNASVLVNGAAAGDPAQANVGRLELVKTDGGSQYLAGATFELHTRQPQADGTPAGTPIATATTDAVGRILWELHVGIEDDLSQTFWVRETIAPAGYVLPADPWTQVIVNAGTGQQPVAITNHKPTGPDLPLTGAQGTMLFTLAGAGLVASAGGAALLQRRARRNRD